MEANNSDIIFVFPPAYGNLGAFKNHLGVAYLRSALAKNGITTSQYLNDQPGTIDMVATDIIKHNPRIIGFTIYDANFILALTLARAIKQQNPKIQVVMGGPTSTFGAKQIMEYHDVVDVCVMGEAEETGTAIFTAMLNGHTLDDAQQGVCFRRNGTVVCNELSPLVGSQYHDIQSALDSTPSPYLSGILTDGRTGVLTGRGCTHHCQYCAFAALGRKKLRLHSIDRVLAELEYIAEQQKRTGDHYIVPIHDDAFTLFPERAKKLCQSIADRNFGLVLSCITRADSLDDELLKLMHDAGFSSLAFGLESAVPSVLRATGKVRPPDFPNPDLEPERHFIEQVKMGVIGAKKHGFNVGISIILGLPTETSEDGLNTLRFVKKLPVDFYMHNFLWVFPGTPLWETHERYGIGCALNPMGLPTTYEYAYDVSKLRPRPKCSLEHDAHLVRLFTIYALYSCESVIAKDKSISTVILNTSELSVRDATWLTQVLNLGGIVIQVYPRLKRSEVQAKLYNDRCTLSDNMVPARHHIQVYRKSSDKEDRQWQISCSGVDLYTRHKPHLLSFNSSNNPDPLLDWLKGVPVTDTFCDVSDSLRQPDELVDFLRTADEPDIGERMRRMPIPPNVKYIGRWIQDKAPCFGLKRIEVDEQGNVRCCRHGQPIGMVGDTRESMARRLSDLARDAEKRRGCDECPNEKCTRCPFPGVSDQAYCNAMKNHTKTLQLLRRVHTYGRLPFVLENLRDKQGSE